MIFLPLNIKTESRRKLLLSIDQFCGSGHFDVILCHFGPIGQMVAKLREIGVLSGPIATIFHGADVSRTVRHYGPHVYDFLFAHGDLFLPISDYWKKTLINMGCPENKILVHKMGIDRALIHYSARRIPDNNLIQLVSVARLVEKKGMEFSLRAFARVQRELKSSSVIYNIIGDGPQKSKLKQLASDLNLSDKVVFHGWQDRDETVTILAKSHILLAPRITATDGDQEGIPVSIMEAMATGVPVISTLHSGIPELVRDGVNGFLVPELDAILLAKKLLWLVENPSTWEAFGRAGRKAIEKNHDQVMLLDQLLTTLNALAIQRTAKHPAQ